MASLANYKLFTPFELAKGLTLQNRVVFSPCTRARSDMETRAPTEHNAKYYEARAGAGLIISEGVAVSAQGYGWFGAPALYTQEQADGWRTVVDRVHARGGKIFAQLWHMGRQSHPSFHPETNEVVSCSSTCYETGHTHHGVSGETVPFVKTRAMTVAEIKQVIEDHRASAALAKAAGFDGVEFHGAGGYLIDEFLQTSTNLRTDEYGGSVENRFRLLRELIEAVTTVYPADRVAVRLSPNGVYGGMGGADNYEVFSYVFEQLSAFGLAYVATHDGFGFGRSDKCKLFTAFDIKTLVKGTVMTTCSHTRDTGEGALRSGAADLVGYGRPWLVNPDLVERFKHDWPLNPPLAYEFFWNAKKGLEGYAEFEAFRLDSEQKKQGEKGAAKP
jgi:N-ethylmaleimide reductase